MSDSLFGDRQARMDLLDAIGGWSEEHYRSGWYSGVEEILHARGGMWEVVGRAVGWPLDYDADCDEEQWATWDDAGRIFAGRKA